MAGIPDGWPCAILAATPPSIIDREAAPAAADLLPQVLALTPRGPAWGTDEAGDGRGASPVQRSFWLGVATWVGDHLERDFAAASQTFPSALTYTLPDWEIELGLPDTCGGPTDAAGRIRAVRARFGALGGSSAAYFICLAASAGYAITIEEPTQFLVDVSAVVGPDLAEGWFLTEGAALLEDGFRCDEGACDDTPVESFTLPASIASGDGGACDGVNLVEVFFTCDDGACGDTPLEAVIPALEGTGDRVETFALFPAAASGDAVAGLAPFETFFGCDDSECDGDPIEGLGLDDPAGSQWKFWVVHLASGGDTFFTCDEAECDGDPIEGFVAAAALECLIREQTPPHTQVVFAYDN